MYVCVCVLLLCITGTTSLYCEIISGGLCERGVVLRGSQIGSLIPQRGSLLKAVPGLGSQNGTNRVAALAATRTSEVPALFEAFIGLRWNRQTGIRPFTSGQAK